MGALPAELAAQVEREPPPARVWVCHFWLCVALSTPALALPFDEARGCLRQTRRARPTRSAATRGRVVQ